MLEDRNILVPDATFVIEMIAFLVVLVVMTRWVLPRIRAAMRAREQAIAHALSAADEAATRRREAEQEAAAILASARREARRTKEQAWSMRDAFITEARRAGVEEYRWLSGRAQRERQRTAELAEARSRHRARAAATAAVRAYVGEDADLTRIVALVDAHFDANLVAAQGHLVAEKAR